LSGETADRLAAAQAPFTEGLEQTIAPLAGSERAVVARFFDDLAVLSEELDGTPAHDDEVAPKPKLRAVPSLWA
jgi:hypothetical protein